MALAALAGRGARWSTASLSPSESRRSMATSKKGVNMNGTIGKRRVLAAALAVALGSLAVLASAAQPGRANYNDGAELIAFASNRTGNMDIWVMNADGTNPVQLTNDPIRRIPTWSPDGRKIAFARGKVRWATRSGL